MSDDQAYLELTPSKGNKRYDVSTPTEIYTHRLNKSGTLQMT